MLLRELSDDEDEHVDTASSEPDDPSRPWLRDFRSYLDTQEHIQDGWTTVMWWGVCHNYCHLYSRP